MNMACLPNWSNLIAGGLLGIGGTGVVGVVDGGLAFMELNVVALSGAGKVADPGCVADISLCEGI
jgi:hypothetical protein